MKNETNRNFFGLFHKKKQENCSFLDEDFLVFFFMFPTVIQNCPLISNYIWILHRSCSGKRNLGWIKIDNWADAVTSEHAAARKLTRRRHAELEREKPAVEVGRRHGPISCSTI